MTQSIRQQTIGRRVLMWILICSSFFTFVMTCIQLAFDYHQQSSIVDDQFTQVSSVSIEPISQALWMLDKDLLKVQIEGILKHRDIVYVKVESTDNQNASLEVGDDSKEHDALDREYKLYHDSHNNRYHIGTLHVSATMDNVYQYLRDRVVIIVSIQAIKTFIISFFILLIMHMIVIKHLQDIVRYIRNMRLGDPDYIAAKHLLALNRKDVNDELKQLTSAINESQERLFNSYLDLENQSHHLEQEIELRSESEKALQISSSRSKAMLQSISDAVIALDLEHRILDVNKGAEQLLDMEKDKAVDKDIEHLLPFYISNINNQPKYSLERFFSNRENQDITGYFKRTNEEEVTFVPVSIRLRPIYEDDDQLHSRVVIIRDESESHELKRVTYNATHDYMTGLKNRMGFDPSLEEILTQLKTEPEKNHEYTLAVIDLDKFKFINDTYGHQYGDEILCFVADEMKKATDENDIPARLGGDEFVILFNKDVFTAESKIHVLLNALKSAKFDWQKHQHNLVSASIGITPLYQNDKANVLFNRADMASYSVKYNGGGSIRTAFINHENQSETKDPLTEHSISLKSLHDAIRENQLTLHAQPIKPLSPSMSEKHLEILIRLKGSDRLIMPNEFISVADAYKYTPNIDLWVLKKLASLIDDYHLRDWTFHVNLSPHTFVDTAVSNKIFDVLKQMNNRANGNTLCFEFTESVLLDDKNKLIDFIIATHQYRCKFALDNYGSGYLSHAHLKDVPLDMIKIDGQLIKQIEENQSDTSTLHAIIEMCDKSFIKTVAECVQTNETIQSLESLGVHYAQGYLISHIHPIENFFDSPKETALA